MNAESQFFNPEPASCQDEDDLKKICSNQMMTFGGSALKSVKSHKTPKWAKMTNKIENVKNSEKMRDLGGEYEFANSCVQRGQQEEVK